MLLSTNTTVRMFFLCLLACKSYTQSSQQIFYKTFDNIDILFDPRHNIYPVIHLSSSCPFIPVKSCDIRAFYWEQFEKRCNVSAYCPNSTHVQCVENTYPWKDVRLVCGPIGNCDRDSRNIVYIDMTKPNVYQLGKQKCEDGLYHSNNNVCFGDCTLDTRVIILQKSTSSTPALAYCNYGMGYCNARKPKVFELTDDPDTCYLAYERKHQSCPPGTERLSDCSCNELCQDGYIRDPNIDFRCKIDSQVVVYKDTGHFRPIIDIHVSHHATWLRLTLDFTIANGICVKGLKILNTVQPNSRICTRGHSHIEQMFYIFYTNTTKTHISQGVTYRKTRRTRENILDNNNPNSCHPKYTDIGTLIPGQTYVIKVQIIYEHDGNMRNVTLQRTGTTRPNPVDNLTVDFIAGNIELKWKTPRRSRQDHYRVTYRMVRRNRKPSWLHNTTHDCNYTLRHPFPGEEYEIQVYSVSNGTSSEGKSLSQIIPPLSPYALHFHFPSPSASDVIIFWFKNDTRSHVEKWDLRYNSSNLDNGQMDIPVPDNGNRVQATISDVRRGNIYRISVYSLVGVVCSSIPVHIDVKIPIKEESGGVPGVVGWISLGIVIFVLLGVVFLVVLQVFKKVPVIRHIRNNFNIDRLTTTVNNDVGDLNLPLADVIAIALNNNEGAVSDDSSESGDN